MEYDEKVVFDIPIDSNAQRALENMNSGSTIFEDSARVMPMKISNSPTTYRGYVPWGTSNTRPYEVINLRRQDEVMSTNIFTKILMGYGLGITHTNPDGTPTTNKEVLNFFKYNRPTRYLLEQETDMKHFFFSLSLLILSVDGKKIVKLRHLDASYSRLETANPDTGKVEHVYYGNFENGNVPTWDNLDVYELLDAADPLGDLETRMGVIAGPDGKNQTASTTREFVMMNFIPVPGNQYYPFPYSWAVFNSGWYDIKQLIAEGKKIKFKNGLVIKYQVEVNSKYWENLFTVEKITDPELQKARMMKEKQNFKEFLTGMQNAGKVWFSGFYTTPDGKEQSMVRINVINGNSKEGGDWLDDTEEASNMECYADGMPPQMIGAVPGKSKASFSGTDKRETFTMIQALEVPVRQLLLEPYFVIVNYNGWENDVIVDIPFMQLTTLDKGTDAQPVQALPAG